MQSEARPCRKCGTTFARTHRGAGRPAEYCSEACRRDRIALRFRSCDHCGTAFVPDPAHWRTGRFCSKTCRDAGWLAASNAAYRDRATPREYTCEECSGAFTLVAVTHRLTGQTRRRFCSYQCKSRRNFRELYGAGGGRRFGRVNGRARLAVFERDGWRCQLCHAVVDRSLAYPSPGMATIDHVIPLASGGSHDPSNWQTAHLGCNVEKGTREGLAA